jgi:hypothetical protein
VLESPSSHNSQQPESASLFDNGGILFGSTQGTVRSQDYYPTQWQAILLWQTFINNVDPIVKILHIPTAQTEIYRTINNPDTALEDMNSLLFAIYFGAITSLSPNAAADLVGQPKAMALDNFKKGFECSLSRSNVLDSPSMKSLQALGIYMVRLLNTYRLFLSLRIVVTGMSSSL